MSRITAPLNVPRGCRECSSVTLSDNLLGDLDQGGNDGRKRAHRSLRLLRAEIDDRIASCDLRLSPSFYGMNAMTFELSREPIKSHSLI